MIIENIKSYALLGLGVTLIAFTGYHYVDVAAYKVTVSDLEKQVGTLSDALDNALNANNQLVSKVSSQNIQIELLATEADFRVRAAEKAMAEAAAVSAKWKGKYKSLLDSPPAKPDAQCDSLALRVDDYLTLRKSEVAQ